MIKNPMTTEEKEAWADEQFEKIATLVSCTSRTLGSAFRHAASKRVGLEVKLCHFNRIRIVVSDRGEIFRAECGFDISQNELSNCIFNLVDRCIEQND